MPVPAADRGAPADDDRDLQPGERWYTVGKGDTLSSIAARHLGGTSHYDRLFAANRDRLNNPNDLQYGMRIRLPSRDVAATSAAPQAGDREVIQSRAVETRTEDAIHDAIDDGFGAIPGPAPTRIEPSVPEPLPLPQESTEPVRTSPRKFIPVHRSPLNPGYRSMHPAEPQPESSSPAIEPVAPPEPAARPRRRLSQLAPEGFPQSILR